MKFNRDVFLIALIPIIFSVSAIADTEKGIEIAKERKMRDSGWGDSTAEMKMVLKSAQGEKSERKLRVSALEVKNDGDMGLTIFDEPLDIKGTAFLNHSHPIEADDQWLYLPALKRVKRISSRNKSGPFMGSEFSYEDLSSFEIEKYKFHYIRDELINDEPTYVLEQISLDENSGYIRQLVWIEKSRYIPLKVEFYDKKDSLLKTLTFDDYKLNMGRYWRSMSMNMVNHQTNKSTLLITDKISFNTGLTEVDFNQNTLKNIK